MIVFPRGQDDIIMECEQLHWVLNLALISRQDLPDRFATQLLRHGRWGQALHFANVADMLLNDCADENIQ